MIRLGRLLPEMEKGLAGAGFQLGRSAPDPADGSSWEGRSHWGWASAYTSAEADIASGLCDFVTMSASLRPGALLRPGRPFGQTTPPQNQSQSAASHRIPDNISQSP